MFDEKELYNYVSNNNNYAIKINIINNKEYVSKFLNNGKTYIIEINDNRFVSKSIECLIKKLKLYKEMELF